MEDTKIKDVGIVLLIFLACVVFIMALFTALYPLMVLECNSMTADIGIPHRYLFWGGCQVLDNERWIPLDNWRYVEVK